MANPDRWWSSTPAAPPPPDAGTGDGAWSADLPAERAALLGDIVVVRNAATLQALDLRTGRHRWLLAQTGTMDDLQPFGDTVVAATQLGTS